MTATIFDWYKTTLEFLKGNKILMFIVLSLFGGNIYQAVAPTSTTKPERVVVKQGCGQCLREIEKLKRWH